VSCQEARYVEGTYHRYLQRLTKEVDVPYQCIYVTRIHIVVVVKKYFKIIQLLQQEMSLKSRSPQCRSASLTSLNPALPHGCTSPTKRPSPRRSEPSIGRPKKQLRNVAEFSAIAAANLSETFCRFNLRWFHAQTKTCDVFTLLTNITYHPLPSSHSSLPSFLTFSRASPNQSMLLHY
jgi:hypothetical protein